MDRAANRFFVGTAILAAMFLSYMVEPVGGEDKKDQVKSASSVNLARYYGFGEMEILKLQWSLGSPHVADVNHDGLNDIIVVNNRKARIDLLLQKKDFKPGKVLAPPPDEQDINDIFGKEATWRFKKVSYDLDVAATALLVSDLNGDGWDDLAYYSGQGLYIVLQEKPKKQPFWKRKKKTAIPYEPKWLPSKKFDLRGGLTNENALASGDLNGDKRTDIALLTSRSIYILFQDPKGTFENPLKYHIGTERPRQIGIADINGDGRDDLVILAGETDYPVRIRFQQTDGKLGPEVRYRLPRPSVLTLAKLGKSKKTVFITVSANSGRLLISALAPNPRTENYPVYTYPLPYTDQARHRDIVSADVDGDGLDDVVATDPTKAEFLLLRAGKKTSLGLPERYPGLMDMRKLCTGRLDGEKKQAIIALSVKEKLIGISRFEKGRLTYPQAVAISGEPLAMDLADIDGDKKLDLVYISRDKKTRKYTLGTVLKVGTSDAKPGPQLKLTKLTDKPLDLRLADIDHDGRCDAMVLLPYSPILLIRQPAPGKFVEVVRSDIHAGLVNNVYPQNLSFAKIGKHDETVALITRTNFTRTLFFDPQRGWTVIDQYQAPDRESLITAASSARLADRSKPAIIMYDSAHGKLFILTPQKDGTYRSSREIEIGSITIKKIIVGQFGGLAKRSILLAGTHKIMLIPAIAHTQILRKIASFETDIKNGRFGAITVGDINSDGCPDIVLCEQARHHVEILTFNPKGKLVAGMKFKVFEAPRRVESAQYDQRRTGSEPRSAIIGDVTNDKKADLILLVHDRIIIYPQD